MTRSVQISAVGLLSLAAACQGGAEIGWSLGPLREVLPLQAGIERGQLRLLVTLVGWDGRSLGGEDRVRTTAGIFRLRNLERGDVLLVSGGVVGPGGQVLLSGAAAALSFRERTRPTRLVLLIDNSMVAAAADPTLARLAASRAIVDAVACQRESGCPLGPSEVSVLAMQAGTVIQVAGPSLDARVLDAALQSLANSAGGEAPLWDGLAKAVGEAQGGDAAASPAAVLCYTASGAAGPSSTTAAELDKILTQRRAVRVIVVQQQGLEPQLVSASRLSDGLWLPLGRGGLETTLRAASGALEGNWELGWQLPCCTTAENRLLGTLQVNVGPDRRAADLDLPLLH